MIIKILKPDNLIDIVLVHGVIYMKFAICDSKINRVNQICAAIDKALFGTSVDYNTHIFTYLSDLEDYGSVFDVCIISEENYDKRLTELLSQQDKDILLIYIVSNLNIVYELMKTNPYQIIYDKRIESQINDTLLMLTQKFQYCDDKFIFRYKGTIYSITLSKIMYFEYYDRYIKIYTCTNDIYRYIDTLCSLESHLHKNNFVRVHSGFIVNMQYIKSISRELILLINNTKIPVSRHKYPGVKKKYCDFLSQNNILR